MQEHSKRYPDYSEYKKRFGIFKENMKKVQFLRETERGSGKYGATKFADLTEEEFKERHLGLYTKQYDPVLNEFDSDLPPADIPSVALPESFDWSVSVMAMLGDSLHAQVQALSAERI